MSQSSSNALLPLNVNNYHNQQTSIQHNKKSKNNIISTEEYRFSFAVNEGDLFIFYQKGGGRKQKITKESQVKAMTVDILHGLLSFMQFDFANFATMKKKQLVDFICAFLSIPTISSLEISENNIQKLLCAHTQHLMSCNILECLLDFIKTHCSNLSITATILSMIASHNNDALVMYIKYIYDQCTINLKKYANEHWKYQFSFEQMLNDETSKQYQSEMNNMIQRVLNEFNTKTKKQVKLKAFMYSFVRCIFRLFNYNSKHFIVQKHVEQIEQKFNTNNQDISEQKKCAIYKYFGSAINALWNMYSVKSYSKEYSESLLFILKLCLLDYDQSKDRLNLNEAFFKVPLRLRLQNRGKMKLIHSIFYQQIAIKMFDKIKAKITKNLAAYEPKDMKQISVNMIDDTIITQALHTYLSNMNKSAVTITVQNELKVLKDLSHRVTTRYLTSTRRESINRHASIGQHRTNIRSLCMKY